MTVGASPRADAIATRRSMTWSAVCTLLPKTTVTPSMTSPSPWSRARPCASKTTVTRSPVAAAYSPRLAMSRRRASSPLPDRISGDSSGHACTML